MSVKDTVESWLSQTPKRLIFSLFALAGASIVVVLAALLLVAPRIAALPNNTDSQSAEAPGDTEKSTLLVEVKGQDFRTNSTLKMGPSTTDSASPGELNAKDPGEETGTSEEPKEGSVKYLNLEGLEDLTFPVSLRGLEENLRESPDTEPTLERTRSPKPFSSRIEEVQVGDPVRMDGMRAFHLDLKNGDFSQMQRNCWTITPEVFADRYTTDQAQKSLLEALSTRPNATKDGVQWVGEKVTLEASWRELASGYTCPTAAYGGHYDSVTPEDAIYLMKRLMTRTNFPLSPTDTETNYPLTCKTWNPPEAITRFSPEARNKLQLDQDGLINQETFDILEKLRTKRLHLFAPNQNYPMYFRASETQLTGPSAFFYRDAKANLCIGAVVGSN